VAHITRATSHRWQSSSVLPIAAVGIALLVYVAVFYGPGYLPPKLAGPPFSISAPRLNSPRRLTRLNSPRRLRSAVRACII
jgi:hypothetical protein